MREAAGFEQVRVGGEELVAGLFGWANRTLEASADPLDVPWAWRVYAYRGYLLLQTLDRSLLGAAPARRRSSTTCWSRRGYPRAMR